MNTHTLLLEDSVIRDKIDVQAGGKRNGSQRTVRRQRHVVGFGHSGDFIALGNTAGMRQVGLQNSQPTGFQHALKLEAREHTFARRNRNRGLRRQPGIIFCLLGKHRLFNKQRTILFQLFNEYFRHRRANAAVEIEAELNFIAERFANLRDGIHRRIHRARVIDKPQLFAAVEFKGVKTNTAQLLDAINHLCRTVAANPAVGFDFVAHQAAHQLPDRRVQHFAFNIPQRLIDTGDGAH